VLFQKIANYFIRVVIPVIGILVLQYLLMETEFIGQSELLSILLTFATLAAIILIIKPKRG